MEDPYGLVRRSGGGGYSALFLARKGLLKCILDDACCSVVSIAYTGAGTSGRTYLDAMQRLSLLDVVTPKSRPMAAGEPVASVAAGETELAIAPLTTILSSPGITPVAIFPEQVGTHIDMSVFLSTSPGSGATAVLEFLDKKELEADLAAAGIMRFEFAQTR